MPDTLEELARVAARVRTLTGQRDDLIRRARSEGVSLRAVGDACGLSHSGVARVEDRG